MPRQARRTNYTNRTDLIGPAQLANQTAPGQQYGDRAAQQQAQRAIPVAPTALTTGGPPTGAPTPPQPPAQQGPPQLASILGQAAGHNGPGDNTLLNRPTDRPNEPVTAGLPVGPGPGPEALSGVGAAARDNAVEQGTLANLLQSMASQPNAPTAVKALAARAGMGVS